jgi:hypothetical protein
MTCGPFRGADTHCTTRTGSRLGTKVPGTAGTLSLDADACCPDWGTAALPVPDVIEEMVSRVLEDGGDVLVAGG